MTPARLRDARGELVRYSIVGGCGYLLALALYAGQLGVGVSPYAAVPLPFIANGLFNFFANRAWSFPHSGRPLRGEMTRFVVVAAGSLVVNYATLSLLLSTTSLPPLAAQAIAIVAALPVGFLGNKLWAFG